MKLLFNADPTNCPKNRKKHNFELISQKGSHKKLKNIISGKQVIVPFHKGKVLPIGTLFSIINGRGIPDDMEYRFHTQIHHEISS